MLKFAKDETELKFLLSGIEMPEVSYEKVCKSCKSENPRQTGACLYCGSTDFALKLDEDSVKRYNQSMQNAQNIKIITPGQNAQASLSGPGRIIFYIISLFIGFIDFLFFSMIGVSMVLGNTPMPETTEAIMAFATQNMTSLSIVVVASLLLSGIFAVFVLPSMSYKSSFKLAVAIGLLIGLAIMFMSGNILYGFISMLLCAVLTGIGGVIGEFIVHKLNKLLNF